MSSEWSESRTGIHEGVRVGGQSELSVDDHFKKFGLN